MSETSRSSLGQCICVMSWVGLEVVSKDYTTTYPIRRNGIEKSWKSSSQLPHIRSWLLVPRNFFVTSKASYPPIDHPAFGHTLAIGLAWVFRCGDSGKRPLKINQSKRWSHDPKFFLCIFRIFQVFSSNSPSPENCLSIIKCGGFP